MEMVTEMTEIIKCSKCGQKVYKDWAEIENNTIITEEVLSSDEDAQFFHKGCKLDNTEQVTCMICNEKFKMITPGHLTKHNVSIRDYKLRYGPVVSESQRSRLAGQSRVNHVTDDILRAQLEAALETIESNSSTIEELTESLDSRPSITDSLDEAARSAGIEVVNTGPRTVGVVFTIEEIEQIGAVALREMVKSKFGRFESRKCQNIDKLRSLIE